MHQIPLLVSFLDMTYAHHSPTLTSEVNKINTISKLVSLIIFTRQWPGLRPRTPGYAIFHPTLVDDNRIRELQISKLNVILHLLMACTTITKLVK